MPPPDQFMPAGAALSPQAAARRSTLGPFSADSHTPQTPWEKALAWWAAVTPNLS